MVNNLHSIFLKFLYVKGASINYFALLRAGGCKCNRFVSLNDLEEEGNHANCKRYTVKVVRVLYFYD